jgi:hypothetical protein
MKHMPFSYSAFCMVSLAIVTALIIQPQLVQASCSALITMKCDKDVTVKSGGTIILAPGITSVRSATDCTFVLWVVDVVVKPHLGRVIPKMITRTLSKTDDLGRSLGNCGGHKAPALQITYQANRDARGKDEVELRIRNDSAKSSFVSRYHVTIESP